MSLQKNVYNTKWDNPLFYVVYIISYETMNSALDDMLYMQ